MLCPTAAAGMQAEALPDQPDNVSPCLAVPGLAAPAGGWMHVRRYFMLQSKPVQTKQRDSRSEGKTLRGERTTFVGTQRPSSLT